MAHPIHSKFLLDPSVVYLNHGSYGACPRAVFEMNGRLARLVRREACIECGACQLNCPSGAIAVDSGVGCAAAMIRAALTGRKEVTCGEVESCCGSEPASSCNCEAEPSCCASEPQSSCSCESDPSCCCGE